MFHGRLVVDGPHVHGHTRRGGRRPRNAGRRGARGRERMGICATEAPAQAHDSRRSSGRRLAIRSAAIPRGPKAVHRLGPKRRRRSARRLSENEVTHTRSRTRAWARTAARGSTTLASLASMFHRASGHSAKSSSRRGMDSSSGYASGGHLPPRQVADEARAVRAFVPTTGRGRPRPPRRRWRGRRFRGSDSRGKRRGQMTRWVFSGPLGAPAPMGDGDGTGLVQVRVGHGVSRARIRARAGGAAPDRRRWPESFPATPGRSRRRWAAPPQWRPANSMAVDAVLTPSATMFISARMSAEGPAQAQLLADVAVPAERAHGRRHQIAHSGQAGQGQRVDHPWPRPAGSTPPGPG